MVARKLILRKLLHTINTNVVRGRSYENFYTRKFIVRKFLYIKISRSTVLKAMSCHGFLGTEMFQDFDALSMVVMIVHYTSNKLSCSFYDHLMFL